MRTLPVLLLAAAWLAACSPTRRDTDRGECANPCGDECCRSGQECDGDTCVGGACTPKTCEAAGAECGTVSDGCGGELSCGACEAPAECGGGGVANVCAEPGGCTPTTCEALGKNCGSVADGCNGSLSCGSCPSGERCGGGGPNVCGTGACTPESDRQFCARLGKDCGSLTDFDNCDTSRVVASCGSCSGGRVCGAGGHANVCGCTVPDTQTACSQGGAECGALTVTDACGATRTVSCGGCGTDEVCGRAGSPNTCFSTKLAPGSACTAVSECAGGANADCLNIHGGYCTILGCAEGGDDCPAGSFCVAFGDGETACLQGPCQRNADCGRSGYLCDTDHSCWSYVYAPRYPGGATTGATCSNNGGCESGVCFDTQDGYCSAYCRTDVPGSCPQGAVCNAEGICLAPCTDDGQCRSGYTCVGGGCWVR